MKRLLSTVLLGGVAAIAASSAHAEVSAEAHQAVLRALDDEYRAEAFYDAVMKRHGVVRPFSRIIYAEQRHSEALIAILTENGLDVPQNTYLGSDEMAAATPATLAEACAAGVTAEIENAALYDDALLPAVADYPDIVYVFENLRDASQYRHLPAFQRCGDSRGARRGQGRGMGRGMGGGYAN